MYLGEEAAACAPLSADELNDFLNNNGWGIGKHGFLRVDTTLIP